jgi:hypothetical protein
MALYRRGQNTVVPIRFILFAVFLAGSFETFMNLVCEQEQFVDRKKKEYRPPYGYEEKLVKYRKRWLNILMQNPNSCRYDLYKADRATCTWLRRHDYEWMLNNTPSLKGHKGGVTVFDYWDKIDNELENMVDDAIYQIKNLVGKPMRATKTNIGRYIGKEYLIDRKYKFLPRTMNKIEQYAEKSYDYQLRKIEWAKSELIKEGSPATLWITLRKAGINDKYANEYRYLFSSKCILN